MFAGGMIEQDCPQQTGIVEVKLMLHPPAIAPVSPARSSTT
jgi:hypothetical protein